PARPSDARHDRLGAGGAAEELPPARADSRRGRDGLRRGPRRAGERGRRLPGEAGAERSAVRGRRSARGPLSGSGPTGWVPEDLGPGSPLSGRAHPALRLLCRHPMVTPPKSSILVVDDDPAIVTALARALSHVGRVAFATSGRDALRMARELAPDLILLDM